MYAAETCDAPASIKPIWFPDPAVKSPVSPKRFKRALAVPARPVPPEGFSPKIPICA